MIRFFICFLSFATLKLTKIYKKPLVFFVKHSMLKSKHAKIEAAFLTQMIIFGTLYE